MDTVLITGANRGIGYELTCQYLQRGGRVFACARNIEERQLQGLSSNYKGRLELCELDLKSENSIATLAKKLSGTALDILLNNAGVLYDRAMTYNDLKWELWEETFKVNTIAPIRISVALLPNLLSGQKKLIASITSTMGSVGGYDGGGYYMYRSSKAALNRAMKSLAVDLHEQGITVLLIHPGWVRTAMGGPEASLEPATSAAGILKLLDNATIADTGSFYRYDGSPAEW